MLKKKYKKGDLVKFVNCLTRTDLPKNINKKEIDDIESFSGIGIILSKDNESGLGNPYIPLYQLFAENYISTLSHLDLKLVK